MADAAFDVVLSTKWKNDKTGKEGTTYTTVGNAFHISNGGLSLRIKHAVTVVPGITELVLFTPKEKGEDRF